MNAVYVLVEAPEGTSGELIRAFLAEAEALAALGATRPETTQHYFYVQEVPIGPGKARTVAEKVGTRNTFQEWMEAREARLAAEGRA